MKFSLPRQHLKSAGAGSKRARPSAIRASILAATATAVRPSRNSQAWLQNSTKSALCAAAAARSTSVPNGLHPVIPLDDATAERVKEFAASTTSTSLIRDLVKVRNIRDAEHPDIMTIELTPKEDNDLRVARGLESSAAEVDYNNAPEGTSCGSFGDTVVLL